MEKSVTSSLQSIQALIEAIREHNAIFNRKDPIPLREAAWNDMARAALFAEASLKQLLADNAWQPIETAPKATDVIAYHPMKGRFLAYQKIIQGTDVTVWCNWEGEEGIMPPTMWRVFPSAPETTEEGK